MSKKSLITGLLLMVLVIAIPLSSMAQTHAVSNGLSWLTSSQTIDGNWPGVATEEFVATATATEALILLNPLSSGYGQGVQWLEGRPVSPTDLLARRIVTLSRAGRTTATEVAQLLALRDASGGWGGDGGYLYNLLDTALALQALKAGNYPDLSLSNTTLAFLINSQKIDGGWGFTTESDSNVAMTAVVSATLQQFPQMTSIATAINKATSYLLAHQNSDGGFGAPPSSTVYETALAYAALVAVSTDVTVLGGTINYLAGVQSVNGSWNDDPYATALALKALYLSENQPAPPPLPPLGGTITGTLVDAVTNQRIAGVAVVLTSDPLCNAITDSAGNFSLHDVPPDNQQVNFSLAGYKSASVVANVVVDATVEVGNIPLLSSYSTGSIAGTITDSTGKALADVAITVNGAWNGSTVTGADGSFSFDYVTPGEVTISATKDAYQTVTAMGTVYARTTLSYSPRLETTPSQSATGTLIGRVVENSWGLPLDHLPGEKGVTVTLTGGNSLEPDPDNGGRFEFQNLVPGTYQVTIGMNGFSSQTFRVVIAAGVTTDLGTIRLSMSISMMTLTGQVTDTISGAPIRGAEVSIDGTQLTGRTDFGGTYAIADINHPSEITIRVSANGYNGKSFKVITSPWLQTLNISLQPQLFSGVLTGRVIDAALGSPLAGVSLSLVGNPAVSATTTGDGMFTIDPVPHGLQQISLTYTDYAPRILTAGITAGVINDVGTIGLAAYPLPASIQGRVWDADAELPFAGVEIAATGSGDLRSVTAADGSYRLEDVNPGLVTVVATPVTKPDYHGTRFTGTLEAGGVLVFSPALSIAPPSTVDVTVQTDKTDYQQGERVGFSIYLQNREAVEQAGWLHVQVSDPTGATLFETNIEVSLPADGIVAQAFVFVLPSTIASGFCTVVTEFTAGTGILFGSASKRFGVAISQVAITLNLPEVFAVGANAISFNLVNTGTLPVTAGALDVVLTDPEGQVVATESRLFALGLGENLNLSFQLRIPDLKFGEYVLSYRQRDETQAERGEYFQLPNSMTIAPLFDSASHRVRETASLTVTLINTGRFNLDPLGAGLPVTVSLPDAGYSETKILSPAPAVGNANGSALLYRFVVPETLTAGQHAAAITITLPSGSTQSQSALLAIPYPFIVVQPLETTTVQAGETIHPVLGNMGGADTWVEVQFKLYDAESVLIVEERANIIVLAGAAVTLDCPIPITVADGTYNLEIKYKNLVTGQETTESHPITIHGQKGTLQAQTERQVYLASEGITAKSSIVNTGAVLQSSNLHLQVTTAAGSQKQKTWTSQYDFQQGTRTSIDTFELPGALTLVPVHDNFDDNILNSDRWRWSYSAIPVDYAPIEQNGSLRLALPTNPENPLKTWLSSTLVSKFTVDGDFDVMVDYDIVKYSSRNNHAAALQVNSGTYNMRIDVWGGAATYGTIDSLNLYGNSSGALLKGKFRIKRVGKTYYSYNWNGSSWRLLASFPNRIKEPAYFSLRTFGQGGAIETLYDNFTVVTHSYPKTGTVQYKYDSGDSRVWDTLAYNADIPEGTSIAFRTRTAETEAELVNALWSATIATSGDPIASPRGRWIEVEATLATTNPSITPVLQDITVTQGQKPGTIVWQADLPVLLGANTQAEQNHVIGAIPPGKYYLQGTLATGTGQMLASSEYPFYVVEGETVLGIKTDKVYYVPGEVVTISGEIKNLATTELPNLALILREVGPVDTERSIYSENINLAIGENRTFTVTTVAEEEGTYSLFATLSQNSKILAESADQYQVTRPTVTAWIDGPETASSSPFDLTLAFTNAGKIDARIVLDKSFNDEQEALIMPAGQTILRKYTQQIATDTSFIFTVSGDMNQTLTQKVTYIVLPTVSTLKGIISTDQATYNPNQTATLTAIITAESRWETLTASFTVSNDQGRVLFSTNNSIPALSQGQSTSIHNYWSVANNPAGSFLVTLRILDATGVVRSTSTCSLIINSTSSPAALLRGTIALDKQSILSGEPITASYRVTNVGNADLSGLTLTVQIVAMGDQAVYHTLTDQATLPMGATYAAQSGQIATADFGAMDYLVVLLATIDGAEETLAGTYLRIEGAPSVPALIEPVYGSEVMTLNPTLIVSNAADPNDDNLTYEFEIYSDRGLTTFVTGGTVPESAPMTLWYVPTSLEENQSYFWRVRAYDGRLFGPWMEISSFRVNIANDPPSAPQISSPATETSVAELTPTLVVDNAGDPDSSNLVYHFMVASDPDFNQVVAEESGIVGGETMTACTLTFPLEENGWYYWRVQADDLLAVSPWSATAKFLVNSANDPPTTPVIIAPAVNSVLAAESTDVVVSNSTDPDSPILSYYFEADTAATFDSADLLRSEMVIEGQETTLWNLTGLLENTGYFLRAKATDSMAESSWSAVTGVFVNAVNEPPTTPVLANPSDGSGVNLLTPTLSVRNATDPDRDPLTYEFAVYTDAALTNLTVRTDNIAPSPEATAWAIPWALTENQTYYWQARATDGLLASDWMPTATFMINTANDAPGAPQLSAPAEGMTVETLPPVLTVVNALDPDSDQLTYDFEFFSSGIMIAAFSKVAEGTSGTTSVTLDLPLTEGNTYSWRVRAFDGDLYGPWMTMANFSIPKTTISIEIKFEPETLNKRAEGQWVQVMIELPHGYKAADIDLSSIRLEGTIPAEPRPLSMQRGEDAVKLTVKFNRSKVITALPSGKHVPVHMTGRVGSTAFVGVDFIRVLDYKDKNDKDDKGEDKDESKREEEGTTDCKKK